MKTSKKTHYPIGKGVDNDESRYISSDAWINITYPLPFDRFVLLNNDNQAIRLESVSTKPVKYVDWFINSRHYARTGPPYHAYWRLEKGRHIITAVLPNKKGDSVEIMVE